MRKLIAITTLGLALSFPTLAFASDCYKAFGVKLPMVKSKVENEVMVET
ncbi:MAG TPA: hypothetical protein VI935_03065 [Thermodesulfobacteriota bacterium]|nr:hypothetical protein [Thermodesulfobacteriota bacterium]